MCPRAGFPFCLLIILVCGAELFTGNTALVTAAVYEKRATLTQLAKSWGCSLFGNVLGCALGVALFANSGLLPLLGKGAAATAVYKTSSSFAEVRRWGLCASEVVWRCLEAHVCAIH